MKSMTGYGRGESRSKNLAIVCEISSVNQKARDIFVRFPREIENLEPRIREEISHKVVRGKLSVSITMQSGDGNEQNVSLLNEDVARHALKGLRKLQKDLGLSGEVRIETLLRIPGILNAPTPTLNADSAWPTVQKSLQNALGALLKMRLKEGAFLKKELMERLKNLRKLHAQIAALSPLVVQKHRKSLHERIKAAGVQIDLDDERLIKEIVFFADRSDITEELTRLKSHFAQMQEALNSKDPVGRTLDFLIQELNREVNTIGSKANNVEISQRVVEMKAELEKVREQIQNIE
ncbi:MAG: YicC/YloC family endoribonuclease [Verrucomicrobiota bacterium]|nr:YicC/YloC family endoribonuclease [Verrucomicrobiota bacterium]